MECALGHRCALVVFGFDIKLDILIRGGWSWEVGFEFKGIAAEILDLESMAEGVVAFDSFTGECAAQSELADESNGQSEAMVKSTSFADAEVGCGDLFVPGISD